MKVPRQCPFVLLVKFGQRQGRALGSEEGDEVARRIFKYAEEEMS
jgi:hypothetical protein